jgi:uncharacterized protein (DUF488 family)
VSRARPRTPHRTHPITIYTIGHSTHPLDEFLGLLEQHQIAALVDVRSYPASRRLPQYNRDALTESLPARRIAYHWLRALGGRRRSNPGDSPHTAWKVAAFRAYADYADTPDFAAGLEELFALGAADRTAFMCAEGLWWQCHRRIISDHLLIRGASVMHILPAGALTPHALPDFASLHAGRLIYAGPQPPLDL